MEGLDAQMITPQDMTAWLVTNGGLARTNRFILRIQPPDVLSGIFQNKLFTNTETHISIACESVTMPPQTLTTSDARTYGSAYKLPWGRSYDTFSTTFLVGTAGFERKLFDAWLDLIADPYTGDMRYHSEYNAKEVSVFCVPLHVSENFETNSTFHWKAYGAYPVSVAGHEFSHTSQDDVLKLQVEWTAMEWNLIDAVEGRGPVPPELRNLSILDVAPPFVKKVHEVPNTLSDSLVPSENIFTITG